MKIEFWSIGKTAFPYLKEGIAIYEKRLKHYINYQMVVLPDVKNAGKMKNPQLKLKEGDIFLNKLDKGDFVVLLDEAGKEYTSVKFSQFLEQKIQMPYKRIIFIVGGAFGFSPAIYERANTKLSLSKMTFSHQMIRLFFVEQLYRACTIMRNEKYHNS